MWHLTSYAEISRFTKGHPECQLRTKFGYAICWARSFWKAMNVTANAVKFDLAHILPGTEWAAVGGALRSLFPFSSDISWA